MSGYSGGRIKGNMQTEKFHEPMELVSEEEDFMDWEDISDSEMMELEESEHVPDENMDIRESPVEKACGTDDQNQIFPKIVFSQSVIINQSYELQNN